MTPRWPAAPAAWSDGDAELQTDVMRFVAILALCLVAIFALVQAVPLESPPADAAPPAAIPAPPVAAPQVVRDVPQADVPRPAPTAAKPVAEPAAERVAQPVAEPAADSLPASTAEPAAPSAAPSAPPSAPGSAGADSGFTLRFESDAALTTLVARSEIGLYAVGDEEARRLHVAPGRLEFWPASTPSTFHEMDPGTVPGDVVAALARSGHGAGAVRWGVTLPSRLARDIDRRIAAGGSGDLVIAANGTLRQE